MMVTGLLVSRQGPSWPHGGRSWPHLGILRAGAHGQWPAGGRGTEVQGRRGSSLTLPLVPTWHRLIVELLLKKNQAAFRTKKDGSNSKRCLLWSLALHTFLAVPCVCQIVGGALRSGWSPVQVQCLPHPCGRRTGPAATDMDGQGMPSQIFYILCVRQRRRLRARLEPGQGGQRSGREQRRAPFPVPQAAGHLHLVRGAPMAPQKTITTQTENRLLVGFQAPGKDFMWVHYLSPPAGLWGSVGDTAS